MRYWLAVFSATLAACGGSNSFPPDQPVVDDTTPPVITLTGANPQLIEAGEAYTEMGAAASDNVDGDLSASIIIDASAVDTTVPGDHTVTYDVSDSTGNAATTVTRTVAVRDTTPPVISLVGEDPQVVVTGDPYTEFGATASDSLDGDVTASIVIDASAVDTARAGGYAVTYDVRDTAGNAAVTVTRTVRVENPPLPAAPTVSIEGDIKTLIFSWNDADNVDFYRLYVSSAAQQEMTQVGDDIPAAESSVSLEITVHLFDFEGTQYELEACNRTGCTRSPAGTVEDLRESTIGYFKAFEGTASDDRFRFGSPLALSGSGKVMAIGDRNRDVYIYRSVEGVWREDAKMSADGNLALTSIALNRNGNVLGIGRGDQTTIFSRENDAYVPTAEFDLSGSVDMSADGRMLAIGVGSHAENTGAVYVFRLQGSTWRQTAFLMASNADPGDQFGNSVSLGADGSILAVGAPYEQSTASGINGDQDDNSSFGEGAAYIFEYRDSEWVQTTYIKSTDGTKGLVWYDINDFAYVVELSGDGRTLAVGNPTFTLPGNGDVHVYRMDSGQWILDNVFYVRDLCFSDGSGCSALGEAISLSADGNTLALGCQDCDPPIPEDGRTYEDFGVAYVYSRESGEWDANPGQLLAPNWLIEHDWCDFTQNWAYCGNDFGKTIALSEDGKTLAVGSNDPSAATGIGGDWDDNSLRDAGSVFLY